VAARWFGLDTVSADDVRQRLRPLVPAGAPGEFAQAMMDLGATICRPVAPKCDLCPLADECAGYRSGNPERFPAPKLKAAKPHRSGVAYWMEQDGCIRLVRRPAKGLLGGMAALPGPEWSVELQTPKGEPLAMVRHVFTHFTLHLTILPGVPEREQGWWHPIADLASAGLPTLYRKAAAAVLSSSERRVAA
jgi:A/G-specific adenine glycosylase